MVDTAFYSPRHPQLSMKPHGQTTSQILLFPTRSNGEEPESAAASTEMVTARENAPIIPETAEIVLSGSFRKDLAGLARDFDELRDLGFRILSPANITA